MNILHALVLLAACVVLALAVALLVPSFTRDRDEVNNERNDSASDGENEDTDADSHGR